LGRLDTGRADFGLFSCLHPALRNLLGFAANGLAPEQMAHSVIWRSPDHTGLLGWAAGGFIFRHSGRLSPCARDVQSNRALQPLPAIHGFGSACSDLVCNRSPRRQCAALAPRSSSASPCWPEALADSALVKSPHHDDGRGANPGTFSRSLGQRAGRPITILTNRSFRPGTIVQAVPGSWRTVVFFRRGGSPRSC